MDIFVTGATGFVGSAVVRELLNAGHGVIGLTRSDAGSAALERAGARPHRGSLDDPAGLAEAAAASDGVVHTAFDHSFTDFPGAARADLAVVEAVGAALAGSGKPFVVTSATGLAARPGHVAVETDRADPGGHAAVRAPSEAAALALAGRGVRSVVLRLPQVHGEGDRSGFVPRIIAVARERGVSAYVGDGANLWPAVHHLDVARLYRLAVESVAAGTVLHGVAEEGVAFRDLATTVGHLLDVSVTSIAADAVAEHFGWLAGFATMDNGTSSAATRALTGWTPTGPTLLEDLRAGLYV